MSGPLEQATGTATVSAIAEPADSESGPLVSSPISHRSEVLSIELLPKTIRFKRPFYGALPTAPDRSSTEIKGFSTKSQRRLRETAINSGQPLISQFCATYADYWPIDGRVAKRQLNNLFDAIRRKFPAAGYLWALEFQTRNAPHFHIFLTLPASDDLRQWLGTTWNRIADPDSELHRWWHTDRVERNGQSALIPWNMGSGSYICKYLDKQHQKIVPEGFRNTGRFWGNSRGLVPPSVSVDPEQLRDITLLDADFDTGEVTQDTDGLTYITRHLGRYHEKISRRSWFRNTSRSTSVLTGAPIFRRLLAHVQEKNNGKLPSYPNLQRRTLVPRDKDCNSSPGHSKTFNRSSGFLTHVWLAGDQNQVIRTDIQFDSDREYSPF